MSIRAIVGTLDFRAQPRRKPKLVVAGEIPAHLRNGGASVRHYLDETEIAPLGYSDEQAESWRVLQAVRRRKADRKSFLASQTIKPHGVSLGEFLTAHGLGWQQRELARERGLQW